MARVVIAPARARPSVVARIFGVSTKTLWRLEAQGKIGVVQRTQSGQRRYGAENLAHIAMQCPKAKETLGDDTVRADRPVKRPGLTVGEAAAVFGVHARTLQRWEREGKFGPLPRDRRGVRRFRQEDLEAVEHLVYGGVSRKPPWLDDPHP